MSPSENLKYAHAAPRAKQLLNDEYMVDAHDTGSAWSGCSAKSAAPNHAATSLRVNRASKRNANTAAPMCPSRFAAWYGSGDSTYAPSGPAWAATWAIVHQIVYVSG